MNLYLSAVTLGLAAAAVVAAWAMVVWDRRLRAADTVPDVGLSIMERVDDRPDSIGTWRPARPGDTAGTVEPDDAPAEDPTARATYRPCWNPAGGGLYVPPWRDPRTARTAAWQLGTGERRVVPRPSWPAWQEPATSWIAEVA